MPGKPAILLTRPAGRGARLEAGLAARGFRVRHVPCLALEPIRHAHQPPEIAELDQYRFVIVISPTAAELGLELIDRYWPQWPVGQVWLATGRQTAGVVEAGRAGPVVCPEPAREHAEGVLALPELAPARVAGQRVLILKGEGGREILTDGLQRRGAHVHELHLYRRTLPAGQEEAVQQLLADQAFGMSVVLSGATLDNLLTLAGGLASRLRMVPICVPGERLAEQARQAGFRSVIGADGADTGALLRAIDAWWRQQAQGVRR